MAMTNAERQAAFKQRRATANDGQGERSLSTWWTSEAHFALDRLAAHEKTTRRAILERLVLAEQTRITQGMSDADYDRFAEGVRP